MQPMQVVVVNQVQVVRLASAVVFLAWTLVHTRMATWALAVLLVLAVTWTALVALAATGSCGPPPAVSKSLIQSLP